MRTLAIILSALIFISCKNSASTATETKLLPVATTEINTGHNGRFNKKITQIIKTEEAFKAAWKLAFANYSTKEPLPEVNFDTDEIILVTMGEQNSGGNSIEVTKVEASIGFLSVIVTETSPGKNCMSTTVMTYPYQFIKLKKTETESVVFKRELITNDCD